MKNFIGITLMNLTFFAGLVACSPTTKPSDTAAQATNAAVRIERAVERSGSPLARLAGDRDAALARVEEENRLMADALRARPMPEVRRAARAFAGDRVQIELPKTPAMPGLRTATVKPALAGNDACPPTASGDPRACAPQL